MTNESVLMCSHMLAPIALQIGKRDTKIRFDRTHFVCMTLRFNVYAIIHLYTILPILFTARVCTCGKYDVTKVKAIYDTASASRHILYIKYMVQYDVISSHFSSSDEIQFGTVDITILHCCCIIRSIVNPSVFIMPSVFSYPIVLYYHPCFWI